MDRYEDFLASARELGEVQQIGVDSEDVSEEYYDVEARLRNKRKAEERLLTLLEDRDNPYALALPWSVRAVLELFDGLQHPPGSPERAAHLEQARRMDPWRSFAWRAAARWM